MGWGNVEMMESTSDMVGWLCAGQVNPLQTSLDELGAREEISCGNQ